MKKYFYFLALAIACYITGAVNSYPAPHSELFIYNSFSLMGIGYLVYVTIRAWTK